MKENSIRDKIEELEKDRMGYLEADDKVGARRKQKQIEKLELELELFELAKIKNELKVYKKVVSKYPSVKMQIKELLESEDE